jgi:environmental stress-induced protein Ves
LAPPFFGDAKKVENLITMKLILKQQQKVSEWSGGTTTELLISPINATVGEQNFDFRISTAKVLVEKSEFTTYPSYNRKLAILEGKLRIQHNQSDWYTLNKGEQTEFKGEWETRSEGQVVDFNVIYKDCFTVEVESVPELNLIDLNTSNVLIWIYCVKGSLQIDNILLNVGDFIQVNGFVKHIESAKDSLFVKVIIFKL